MRFWDFGSAFWFFPSTDRIEKPLEREHMFQALSGLYSSSCARRVPRRYLRCLEWARSMYAIHTHWSGWRILESSESCLVWISTAGWGPHCDVEYTRPVVYPLHPRFLVLRDDNCSVVWVTLIDRTATASLALQFMSLRCPGLSKRDTRLRLWVESNQAAPMKSRRPARIGKHHLEPDFHQTQQWPSFDKTYGFGATAHLFHFHPFGCKWTWSANHFSSNKTFGLSSTFLASLVVVTVQTH